MMMFHIPACFFRCRTSFVLDSFFRFCGSGNDDRSICLCAFTVSEAHARVIILLCCLFISLFLFGGESCWGFWKKSIVTPI